MAAKGYLSPRASLAGAASPLSIVLGPTRSGRGSYIDSWVVVGYPVRRGLRSALEAAALGRGVLEELDRASRGAVLGERVVVRAGSVVYETAVLGDGVETGHWVLVREETRVGPGSLVGTGTIIDGRVTIGSGVRIESGVYIPPGTVIGDRVFIGPRAVFTNDKYPPSSRLEGARVEDDAVIGANSVILPGITIGRGAVVAAGSVVTRDVPPGRVVRGSPARVVGDRSEYDEKRLLWEARSGGS